MDGENCVEREAARSLLTLSETLQTATQKQHALAGLLPFRVRPSTYPYSYTQAISQPQSPPGNIQPDKEKVHICVSC